jgi:hypothetical protein
MADGTPEIELVFEPQDEGGYHVSQVLVCAL